MAATACLTRIAEMVLVVVGVRPTNAAMVKVAIVVTVAAHAGSVATILLLLMLLLVVATRVTLLVMHG